MTVEFKNIEDYYYWIDSIQHMNKNCSSACRVCRAIVYGVSK